MPGRVETSGRAPDPERHFTALSYAPIADRRAFVAALDGALEQRRPESREIFIFVHGYNNNIAESLFRNAQLTHDYAMGSVSLHYAWPSGASIPLYVFDRDSAIVGRGGLAETIAIAAETKAARIVLLGHSMGAYVVMEALRDLAMSGREHVLKRLGGVVLAAPDIDIDAFQSQADDIGTLPQPFTIVVSRRDRALGFSRRIAGGHPRVGSGAERSGFFGSGPEAFFTASDACGPISSSVGLCGPRTPSPNAPAFVRGSTSGRRGTARSVPGPMSSSEGLRMREADCA